MPHACFLDERKSVHVKAIPRIINIIYVRKRSLWGVKKTAPYYRSRCGITVLICSALPAGNTANNSATLQCHQSVQRRSKVITPGHRFGEAQHGVALTVSVTEHT